MWSCDWKTLKQNNSDVSDTIKQLEIPKPLNPREAFFGGRTEAFKLGCEKPNIAYEDVTSLYPWVNFTMEYPVGHPEFITSNFDQDLENYFGIIKCTVLPPKDLYIPVLPMHCGPTKKLIFPLCKSCADSFQTSLCTHNEKDRAITGTWFTEEVKLAVSKGYRMVKIWTVWNFKERTTDLFKDYVKTFYKKKLLSSPISFSSTEDLEKYIKDVQEKEGIEILPEEAKFESNPGLRQLTKLMLNNLWGRFGMRENLPTSRFVSQFEQLVKLINDPEIDITGIRLVSDKILQVISKKTNEDFLTTSKDTNIFIAVTTTAWARIRLYKELDITKERTLYCDTDSIIYEKVSDPTKNLVIGNFLGEMTNELDSDDSIVDFVSGGPKNYAYRTKKGKSVVKVKGFTLNSANAPAFAFQNVKNLILSGVHNNRKREHSIERNEQIPAKRRKMVTDAQKTVFSEQHAHFNQEAHALYTDQGISVYNPRRIFRTRDWSLLQKPEQKLYSFCFDKRIVLTNNDTLPYGHI
jgi:hypothetical protein